ncbi:MAG: FtsH protease activity modulator HflK [Burkholderiales bacterium]|nr:FtsH protease activity modulator HflK [Burkholderiales bacterium]
MSLNDPRWGRNNPDEEPNDDKKKKEAGSSDESSREPELREPEQREPEMREPELREPRRDKRDEEAFNRHQHRNSNNSDQENDLEELWKQFNDKINSMLGGKGPSTPRQKPRAEQKPKVEEPKPTPRQEQRDDFIEPPPREGHPFQNPQPEQPKEPPKSAGPSGGGRGPRRPVFNYRPQFSKGTGIVAVVALIIAFLAWCASGFYIVPEGQRGVVTTFGKYSSTSNAGIRWHMPWPFQDATLVDISSVRKTEVGMKSSAHRLKEALMLTDDENIVDVMFNVQYRIKDGLGAEEFLFRTRDPIGAVIQTAESAMREVVGRKKMDSVLFESKQEIAEEVMRLMQEMLDRYQSGIQITSVAIQNAQPPEQVQAAFNDAVKAGQDRERQINEGEAYANDVVPKAKGLAERLRQEAEGYKSKVISTAEGDASRFDQVYHEYERAPKVTRDRMYVDTLQQVLNNTKKVLIDSKSSNNLLYLPLDKLTERASAPAPTTTAAAPEQTTSYGTTPEIPQITQTTQTSIDNDAQMQRPSRVSRSLR